MSYRQFWKLLYILKSNTLCYLQSTIIEQSRTIREQSKVINDLWRQPKGGTAQAGDSAKCADAKSLN